MGQEQEHWVYLAESDRDAAAGATWACVDDVFVRDAKGRLSAGGSPGSVGMVSRRSPKDQGTT